MFRGQFSDDACGPRRARWNLEGFGDFWGPGRGRHWRARAGRVFEQGDLKLVILTIARGEASPRIRDHQGARKPTRRFVRTEPRHGLPDADDAGGHGIRAGRPEASGKKIYEITDEGRKHLAEHSTTVNDIFERIAQFVEGLG